MENPTATERRPSAFAAAFFSALQPGLGQLYLRRWGRALVWLAPYILAYAFLAGVIRANGPKWFETQFADVSWDLAAIGIVVVDLALRAVSALDAYRIAMKPQRASGQTTIRLSSLSGLVAVLLVLVISHAAAARPFYLTYNLLSQITNDQGDLGPAESPAASESPPETGAVPTIVETLPPTEAPSAAETPLESAGPTISLPPAPTDRVNILLVGVDSGRVNEPAFNTDTMIVVSIDPKSKQVALISLPRDTQGVPLPAAWPAYRIYGGIYNQKINSLFNSAKNSSYFPGKTTQQKGFGALMGTLGILYNLDINYYVEVNLNGFRDAINALGGAMIDVQIPVNDPFYPADDGRGYLKLYIPPGFHYMDGAQALAYARSRHGFGNDYIRAARQERVVTSIRDQFDLSTLFNPTVLSSLYTTLASSVHTNISSSALPGLIRLAQEVDLNRRVSLVLSPPSYGRVCFPCPPSGQWAIKPNIGAIRQAVASVFDVDSNAQKQRDQIESEGAVVNVVNGTTDSNLKTSATADYLSAVGIDATVPPVNGGAADRSDYTTTVIQAFNGADQNMPATVSALQAAFGVTVQPVTDPKQAADFVVIVGASTPSLKPPG